MQTMVLVLLIALAASYALVVWLHGSITDSIRGYIESDGILFFLFRNALPSDFESRRRKKLASFLKELLLCPFCLAIHVCFWLHVFAWLVEAPGAIGEFLICPSASAGVACIVYPRIRDVFFSQSND